MSDPVAELRQLLATASRILAHENVLDAFGHISARHPTEPDRFLLSRSRSAALVEPGDMMVLDLEGQVIDGDDREPFLERFIHAGVYAARPDVHAVIHNHAHDLIPFGLTGTPIRPLIHMCGAMGAQTPIWDIRRRFGDTSLLVTNMDAAADLAAALGEASVALMRGHGAVVTGASVQRAVLMAIYVQVNARLDLQARQLGEVTYLSPGEIVLSEDALFHENPAARAWAYFESRSQGAGG